MINVQQKLKCCKQKFIRWRKVAKENNRIEIDLIQKEMESMQEKGGERDWKRWKHLKILLNETYKREEEY